jgi:ferrochelatase
MPAPFTGQADHRHGEQPAVGVLLTNVGTPDAPTAPALRRYLRQFLWDPRVIEPPPARWVWKLILEGIILRVRPAKSAALYRNVWTDEGSPLLKILRRQAEAMQARLRGVFGEPLHVAIGMGYGSPSIAHGLGELRDKSCRRILILPAFPQYSGATTGSTFDAVAGELSRWRWVPELRFNTHYHDHPGYIAALAASVREYWAANGRPARLLISFHGMPLRYIQGGDPYHCHCMKTARLLNEALGLTGDEAQVCFQSRFGKEPWLQPYTDETLRKWAREGVGRVDTLCPAFSADCLETLEEMNMTNRELFEHAGGKEYHYIPALNERADHIEALADVAARQMQGWLTPNAGYDPAAAQGEAEATRQRYEALAAVSPNATPRVRVD